MDLKNLIIEAMRSKDQIRANILRVVLSESELTGKSIGKIAEKIISSNMEFLSYRQDEKLVKENTILEEFVRRKMEKSEILDLLSPCKPDIMSLPERKAIGFSMEFFDNKDLRVSNEDVKEVVKELRS